MEPLYVRSCIQDSAQCDLMVSGSGFMTRLYQRAFWYQGSVAEYGTPRNDVLFLSPQPQLSEKVRRAFGLPEDRKLVLYAPTFRADHSCSAYQLDVPALWRLAGTGSAASGPGSSVCIPTWRSALRDCLLTTAAPFWTPRLTRICRSFLCAADILVTDYSSCMFDFALSGKPCFQFATDIEAYRLDRNFYFPWIRCPFPGRQQSGSVPGCSVF